MFKTKVVTRDTDVTINAFYKHSRIKQYLKNGRALRIETVINSPDDLGCHRRLQHLDELQTKARDVNARLIDTERVGQRPKWNLTVFKVNFGLLTLKGYTKGEHVLRFVEAIVHNSKTLHTGRVFDKFPVIIAQLAGMVDRFTSMLDCVDVGFLPDGILDELPTASQLGATRVGGVDINKPRARAALAAVLALALAPGGFTASELAAKARSLTGESEHDYTIRQAAYDLRKLRGKPLVVKPGRTHRYQVPIAAARTISALLTLRDQIIAPILVGIGRPGPGRPPKTRTSIDRDYQNLRDDMRRTLFHALAIDTAA